MKVKKMGQEREKKTGKLEIGRIKTRKGENEERKTEKRWREMMKVREKKR